MKKILGEQIDGFRNTLSSWQDMLKNLAYAQNLVADTLNKRYYRLNCSLLIRAMEFSQIALDELKKIAAYRIVGEEFLIINEGNLSEINRRKLANLLGETVTVLKVSGGQNRYSERHEFVSKKILKQDFSCTTLEDDDNNMYVIVLPRNGNFTAEQIQLTQQIFFAPVVLD